MNTLAHHPAAETASTMRRAGIALSALVVLVLLADALSQLLVVPPILAGAANIGFPGDSSLWQAIGAVLLAATVLYAFPRTQVIGAVLLTGYLGGAICAHVRVREDVIAPTIIAVVLATFAWGGLALRDARLRDLVLGR